MLHTVAKIGGYFVNLYTLDVRLRGPRNLLERAGDEQLSTPIANPLSSNFTGGFLVIRSSYYVLLIEYVDIFAISCRIIS
jgi:hypothetical protein